MQTLSRHPEGLKMKDIAGALNLNRNAVAKYLGILHQQGQVDIRHIGKAKVFTVSKRVPFSILAEISPDYVIGTDRNLNCVAANTRFYEWAGCTPEDIFGKHIDNLSVPVFQRSQIVDLARNGISSACEPVRISCSLQNRDYIYEIRCMPVIFEDCATGSAVIIKDITTSETAAEAISLLEERYRAIADTQSEYIVHSLSDGTITYANPAFAALARVPAEHLTGKQYRLKIPEDDLISVKHHFRSIGCDDPEKSIEHRVLTHSGEIRWIRWKNRGIFRNGTLTEYHSHGTDITDIKTAQNLLLFYHENTEKMIREKTEAFQKIKQDLLAEIQKRRRIERNLQKTQFCINNSREMILWTDETGTITSSNKSALDTLGILPDNITSFLRPGGPQQQPVPWQDIWESAKQNGYCLFEAIMQDRNDKLLHMEVLGNYLYYDDAEYCCLFLRDITIRKQAMEVLSEREERYRTVFENTGTAMIIFDDDTTISLANTQFQHLAGYTREELEGRKRWSEFIAPEDLAWLKKQHLLRRENREKALTRYEFRFISRSGGIHNIFLNIDIIPGTTKSVASLMVITERKTAEDALRECEIHLANAMELAQIVKWELDVASGIFTFDDRFYSLYGTTAIREGGNRMPSEVYVREFVHPDDAECIADQIGRTQQGTIPDFRKIEHRIIRRDGGVRHVGVRVKFVLDPKGRLVKIIGANQDITERKRAEELHSLLDELKEREQEIRQCEQKLLGIVQYSPIPQFVIDKEHRVISWNHALEETTGLKAKAIIGTTDPWRAFYPEKRPVLADLLVGDMPEKVSSWYRGKFRRSKSVEGAYEAMDFLTCPGRPGIWFYFTAAALRDVNGSIIGAVETLKDITEIKSKEAAITESRNSLEKIINAIGDPVFVKDRNHRWVLLNDALCRFMGQIREKLLGKSDYDFFTKEEADIFWLNDELVFSQGIENINEERITDTSGQVHIVITKKTLYTDNSGNPFIVGVIRDITERKLVEATVRRSRDFYVKLFDEFPNPIWHSDTSAKCDYFNKACLSFTGHTLEKEISNGWVNGVHPDDFDQYINTYLTVFKARESFQIEYRFRHHDGTYRWLLESGKPVYGLDGNFTGYIGACYDITVRKPANEEHCAGKTNS